MPDQVTAAPNSDSGHEPGLAVTMDVDELPASDGSVYLDEFTVKVVTLYQQQSGLTDKLWIDFGRFSTFALVVALMAPVAVRQGWLPPTTLWTGLLFVLTAFVYLTFSVGNRSALNVAQKALQRIASQAQMASRITLEVNNPRMVILYQGTLSVLTFAALCTGLWLAFNAKGPEDKSAPVMQAQPAAASPSAKPSSYVPSTH